MADLSFDCRVESLNHQISSNEMILQFYQFFGAWARRSHAVSRLDGERENCPMKIAPEERREEGLMEQL